MLPADPRFVQAESIALDRLIAIARDSESDHEARLAAVAIFNIRRYLDEPAAADDTVQPSAAQPSEAPPTPTPRRQSSSPLTPDELAQLALHLPSVKPQRFLNKHTPAYWREVLHRQPTFRAATGPPLTQRAA